MSLLPVISHKRKGIIDNVVTGWEASDYGTVEFWLDAGYAGSVKQTDDTTDAADGDTVGSWNDRSGNNRNFFTSGSGVKYRASSEPYYLDLTTQTSNHLARSGTYGTTNTLFMVFECEDNGTNAVAVVAHRNALTAAIIMDNGSASTADSVTGTPSYQKNVGINVGSTRDNAYHAFSDQPSVGLVLATMRYSSWSSGYSNGIAFFGGNNYETRAKVYEIVMYDGDLSTENRTAVQQVLVDKYSIV